MDQCILQKRVVRCNACCVSSVAQSRAKQLKPWGIKTCKMIWLLLFLFFFDCVLTSCIDPSLNSLEQDNPALVKHVQDKLLEFLARKYTQFESIVLD